MELETVTYKEVIDGYTPKDDEYGIASYALAEPRRTAFLTMPFVTDKSMIMLKLAREDEKIVGRCMEFPSKFKAGDQIYNTVGGSALQVADEYRKSDAGMTLLTHILEHKEYNAAIYSSFSREALKCHKAMGSKILTFPLLVQIRDFSKMMLLRGRGGLFYKWLGWLLNFFYLPFRFASILVGNHKFKGFEVKKMDKVPEWVDEIVLNDGHKYMEVHDHQWLQWNLNNMFHAHKLNTNSFFTVAADGKNVGFYMIKERFKSIGDDGVVEGSVVEWGTKAPEILSEYDLQLMALNSFSKNTDLVYTASDDSAVVNKLKHLLLFRMGNAEISFKDLNKQFKEAKDSSLWRLRLGYGDAIMN